MMALIIFTIASLLLAACGGTQSTTAPEEQAQEEAAPSEAEPAEEAADTETEAESEPVEEAEPAADTGAEPVTITLARFFGDCDDSTAGVTDVSQATTECEVIQILTNKFNAENEQGITVERLGGAEWGTYYDALNTTFAGGDPPHVAVMHGSNLPDYAIRGLLLPLDDRFAAAGIDPNDWTEPARGAVTYEGQMYGVPFDLHANLFHVNVDLFKEAGLVDDEGNPILPTSREEFFEQAQIMKETTGADYIATDASQFPIGVRILFTLVWQEGSDLIAADGTSATVDTPEAAEALDFLNTLFEEGYANPEFDYASSQQAFLNGEAAILHNGTWAVDQYNREAEFEYRAMDFPTLYDQPAVWANSHMWTIPRQADESNYDASLAFLKFLYDHVGDWSAGTGHLAPRASVLESEQLSEVPQRDNYANTANIAVLVPAIVNWQAVEDILKEEIEATWLTGKDQAQALSDAEQRINDQLAQ
jgi:multiple sugar transport system substrate-binding protein